MIHLYCVGDNNVDIYLNQKRVFPGGCALNAAAYCAMQGHKVSFVSSVGNDRLGELQLNTLKELGVDVSKAHVVDYQTAWCYILLHGNDRVFGNGFRGAKQFLPISVGDVVQGQNGEYDLIYTCTDSVYGEGAFEQFGKSTIPAFCDFSDYWTPETLKNGCSIFRYVGFSCPDMRREQVETLLKKCHSDGAELIIGTMGMDGSLVYNGRDFFFQKAVPVSAVDTLGAGDSFLSTFISSYFDGKKQLQAILDRLEFSNEVSCAAESCEALLIRQSMAKAALFAAATCQSHGAFGHDIAFDYSMVSRSDCDIYKATH